MSRTDTHDLPEVTLTMEQLKTMLCILSPSRLKYVMLICFEKTKTKSNSF